MLQKERMNQFLKARLYITDREKLCFGLHNIDSSN